MIIPRLTQRALPLLLVAASFGMSGCRQEASANSEPSTASGIVTSDTMEAPRPDAPRAHTIPPGAQALIEAYPDAVKGYDNNRVILTDGSSIIYDDGRDKDYATMLDNSDIEDMFFTPYIDNGKDPAYLSDAGRSRCDTLFKKMYGSSAAEVQKRLVTVDWVGGQKVKFTSVNGAADSLRAVALEIARHPELQKYLKSSGTFYWRTVRGAKRMSAHSYGIAFDIGVPHSDYWLWKNPGAGETDKIPYANRFPHKIAEIFRRHGFIWGGAWYHYDTMHFEFRPEILRYADIQ